eukprot:108969_1
MQCLLFMAALLSLAHDTSLALSIWTWSDISLFYSDDRIATGEYNGTIYLLGGDQNRNQVPAYEYKTETLQDIGSNALRFDVWGYSQYWTQVDHILYLIIPRKDLPEGSTPNYIGTYNLATTTFIPTFHSIPINLHHDGCLAHHDSYLYVVGAGMTSVKTLNLNTTEWISNVPDLNT